jgi:hypothetical protein
MQPSYVSAYVGGTPQVNGLEKVLPLFSCNALKGREPLLRAIP